MMLSVLTATGLEHHKDKFTWTVHSADRMARFERAHRGSNPLRFTKFYWPVVLTVIRPAVNG